MSRVLSRIMTKATWTKLGPSTATAGGSSWPCARSSHGISSVLGGSRLVLYGGENVARTPLDSTQSCWTCEVGQPSGGNDEKCAWRQIGDSDPTKLPPERVAHAQAVYQDRYVYVFGGRAGITMEEKAMNDMWVFDAEEEKWSEVKAENDGAEIPEARSFHRMVCVGDHLYVFGGCGNTSGRLNDLHAFDIASKKWRALSPSPLLRGRGGPNFMPLASQSKLAVVAGFAGQETSDAHCFDLNRNEWDKDLFLQDDKDWKKRQGASSNSIRPRSVCISAAFPSVGVAVIFGGEVDPSDRGHEGAGGFENDIVFLDEQSGSVLDTVYRPPYKSDEEWPEQRGWSYGASVDHGNGKGTLYVFGGLSGDDTNPRRLDDLWKLEIEKLD